MRASQTRIVRSLGEHVHARFVNPEGNVVPRCNARAKSRNVLDLVVTSSAAKVSCPRCRLRVVR